MRHLARFFGFLFATGALVFVIAAGVAAVGVEHVEDVVVDGVAAEQLLGGTEYAEPLLQPPEPGLGPFERDQLAVHDEVTVPLPVEGRRDAQVPLCGVHVKGR